MRRGRKKIQKKGLKGKKVEQARRKKLKIIRYLENMTHGEGLKEVALHSSKIKLIGERGSRVQIY